MKPVATVVITTCDRPTAAARAVRSALTQTEAAIQVIVVDDGVAETYVHSGTDERLQVHRTSGRIGVTAARNVGLQRATGQWVTFLDDDDELVPTAVAACTGAGDDSTMPPPVSVIACMDELDTSGQVRLTRKPRSSERGKDYFLEPLSREQRRGLAAYNTLFVPTELLRDLGGWDEAIRSSEHSELFLRLNAASSIQALNSVTYRMHHHDDTRLTADHRARVDGMARTWVKHRSAFARHRQGAAWYLGKMAMMQLRAGLWAPAIVSAARSLARDPARQRAARQLLYALAGPQVLRWRERRERDQRSQSESL